MMAATRPTTLPSLTREEELGLRVGVKRMLLAVQQLFDRDPQRRHPIRVVTVEREGQFHELVQRLLVVYRNDFNTSQS